jgi:tetratricopeptide (TPR) repeat protein
MQMTATPSASAPPSDSSEAFTAIQVSRLFGIPPRRLRYWSQTGFIRPSVRADGKALYSFRDLVAVKVAKALLDTGVPLRRVRRSLARLARHLPDIDTSLANLRVRCEGDEIIVDQRDFSIEAATGQLVLDFEISSLRDQVAEVVSLPWVDGDDHGAPSTAYDWFLRGCELEEEWDGAPADTEGFEAAKQAYEQALALDPALAAAWTNLGSMHAEHGDHDEARAYFSRALECDAEQPEAHCNLAEMAMREGDTHAAIEGYRQVLRLSPDWSEAHYGLARALLRVGGKAQALAHLQRFCAAVDVEGSDDPELAHRREAARIVISRLQAELEPTDEP